MGSNGSNAGWYPQSDGQLHYWDGQRWTPYVAPLPPGGRGVPPNAATVRKTGPQLAAALGFGGLAFAVLAGALSSGLGGAFAMLGFFALVVGVVALIRGRVGWAHVGSRAASAGLIAAALVAMMIGGAIAPNSSPTKNDLASAPAAAAHAKTTKPRPAAQPSTAAKPTQTVAPPSPAAQPKPAAKPAPPPPKPAGLVVNAAGAILPNASRTPGALNPAVTQSNIASTICVSGWTSTIRPSSSITTRLKEQQLASGYAYRGDSSTSDYEEDHLISLELGGSPTAAANLWPEPYTSPEGARVKDKIENKLHALVCSHAISLAAAQHAIATNWWAAYQKYGGSSSAGYPVVHHSAPAPAPAPAPKPAAPAIPSGATAQCNDGTFSYAAHHQGACSHHGGVAIFYN